MQKYEKRCMRLGGRIWWRLVGGIKKESMRDADGRRQTVRMGKLVSAITDSRNKCYVPDTGTLLLVTRMYVPVCTPQGFVCYPTQQQVY
jgi:hypothetical protein